MVWLKNDSSERLINYLKYIKVPLKTENSNIKKAKGLCIKIRVST